MLPEFLPAKPWEYLLHNQSALRLKAALLFRPNTVVADVPYQLGRNLGPLAKRSQSGWRNVPWGPIRALVFLLVLGLIYYFFFLPR